METKEKTAPSLAAVPKDLITFDTHDANVQNNSENAKDLQKKDEDIQNLLGEYEEKEDSVFVCASDLLAMSDTKMPTLYDPILPQVGICVVGGESDAGKSQFLRNLAICVATGREFLGFQFSGKYKSAIYAASEDDSTATAYLMKKHNLFYKDNVEDWKRLHFIFETDNIIERLNERLEVSPADLIVIDSFADFFTGKDQNNSAQVRSFIKPFSDLARKHRCCVVFLHHIGKWQENNTPSKNALVGSQSLEAISRACFLFVKDRSDKDIRHLCVVKHNYIGNDYKTNSIELRMDSESFTFQPTGNRVPFEQLTESANRYKKKSVEDYGTDEEFADFFAGVMQSRISKTALMSAIKDKFKCSQDKAIDILNFYVNKKWLVNVSERTDRVVYEYCKEF